MLTIDWAAMRREREDVRLAAAISLAPARKRESTRWRN